MGQNGRPSRHNGSTEFGLKSGSDGRDQGWSWWHLTKCREFQIALPEWFSAFSNLALFYSPFTDEETEACRGYATCPSSISRKRFFLDSKPGSLTEEPTVLMGLSKVWGWKQPRSWILRGTSVRASGKAEPTRSSPPPSGSMRMRKFSFSHTSTKAHSHSSQQFLMHLNTQKHVPTKICCVLFTHSTGTCFRNTHTSPYP